MREIDRLAQSWLLSRCARAPFPWSPPLPTFPSLRGQSNTHVVLGALKRAPSELGSHQQKMFALDEHLGMAVSGLNADGRVLCRYLRNECLNHK